VPDSLKLVDRIDFD